MLLPGRTRKRIGSSAFASSPLTATRCSESPRPLKVITRLPRSGTPHPADKTMRRSQPSRAVNVCPYNHPPPRVTAHRLWCSGKSSVPPLIKLPFNRARNNPIPPLYRLRAGRVRPSDSCKSPLARSLTIAPVPRPGRPEAAEERAPNVAVLPSSRVQYWAVYSPCRAVIFNWPSTTSTNATPPEARSPKRIRSTNCSSNSFWMRRWTGRAPNLGSYPFSVR